MQQEKKMSSANSSWINIILAQKDSQGDFQIPKGNYNWLNLNQLLFLSQS